MSILTSCQTTFSDLNESITTILTNESNTFAGGSSAALAGSTTTQILAYRGTTAQTVTIISVNGVAASTAATATGITGLTFTCSTLSGTSPTITFTCTTSFVSASGNIPIVVSIGGISFTKLFSYAIAFTATNLVVTPSTQFFKSTTGAAGTFTPSTITLTPTFQNTTWNKWQYSKDGGSTWSTLDASYYNSTTKIVTIPVGFSEFTDTITSIAFRCTAASGVSDTVTLAKVYDVVDIQIGGRNLLQGEKTVIQQGTITKEIIDKYDVKFTNTVVDFTHVMWNGVSGILLDSKAGESITFSAYYKTNCRCKARLVGANSNGSITAKDIDITNTNNVWTKFVITTNVLTDNPLIWIYLLDYRTYNEFGVIEIKNWKLEKGNKATDWTPAPEDVQSQIDKINNASEVVVGTQTVATSAWKGVANIAELKDGQQITYWLPYSSTSTSVTLDLTLNTGVTTGPLNCYYSGASRITTHYAAGNAIHLTYKENVSINGSSTKYTGWWADANYDSNTYDRILLSAAIKAKTAITAEKLIVGDDSGFANLAGGAVFQIDRPILYAGSSIAAAATGTNNYVAMSSINLRSTISGWTGVDKKVCYLVGILDGRTFTASATPLTTTVPTSDDGLTYIALGLMVSTTNSSLFPEHAMYRFINGSFKNVSQIAYQAQTDANTVKQAIADMTSDGIITPTERIALKREYYIIEGEQDSILSQAGLFSGVTAVTTAKNAYTSACTNMTTYVKPVVDQASGNTVLTDANQFRGYFTTYYSSKEGLLYAILNASKGYTDTSVSNVQVGGRNLLLNTDDLTRWTKEDNVRIDDYLSGFYKIYNSSSTPIGRCGIYQDVIVSANTNYTFSVNITSYCYITLGFGGSFGNVIYNGAETKRFVYNFNTGSNTSVRICIAAYDGNASYCYHPQLELGDKATDWRTAPEDLAIYSIDINFVGGSVINSGKDYIIAYAKLMKNGKEIDYNNALNTISETPPLSPSDGTQYYYIDTTNRNVILKQWSSANSIWIDVDANYDYTYKWSKMSSGGALIDLFDANNNRYSKVLYISRDNIDISNIFQCSIYDSSSLNIGGAQITCSDANDTVVGAIPPSNPIRGQFWIDTSNSKYILKMFDGNKWIASDNNTVNVFTGKPNINLGDNYLYHQGDLWIIGDDYKPTGHQSGELLVAVQSRLISLEVNTSEGDTYNDGDWISALSYYDSQLNSLMGNVSTLIEHVIIDETGLKLQATTSSGVNTNFYAKLTSSELGFHETTAQGEDVKVVWLSNQEFHSKKAQIENSVSIVHDSNTSGELSLSIGIFKFKTESNGSLSLVITS